MRRSVLVLICVFNTLRKVSEAGLGKRFQALGLGQEGPAELAFDTSFGNAVGETGDCGGTAKQWRSRQAT